ncbi:unnamed protein product [Urochloa humidicola]
MKWDAFSPARTTYSHHGRAPPAVAPTCSAAARRPVPGNRCHRPQAMAPAYRATPGQLRRRAPWPWPAAPPCPTAPPANHPIPASTAAGHAVPSPADTTVGCAAMATVPACCIASLALQPRLAASRPRCPGPGQPP